MFSEDQVNRITSAISKKGGTRNPCERCGGRDMILLDKYVRLDCEDNFDQGVTLGGESVPAYAMICGGCGKISLFSSNFIDR